MGTNTLRPEYNFISDIGTGYHLYLQKWKDKEYVCIADTGIDYPQQMSFTFEEFKLIIESLKDKLGET